MIKPHNEALAKDWLRAIFLLRMSVEKWAMKNLQELWNGNFQVSYFNLLLTIEDDGSRSVDLARKCGISKQAMSKTVQNLEALNMLNQENIVKDKRSTLIKLTPLGKDVLDRSIHVFTERIFTYELTGREKAFEEAKNTLNTIHKFIKDNEG